MKEMFFIPLFSAAFLPVSGIFFAASGHVRDLTYGAIYLPVMHDPAATSKKTLSVSFGEMAP